MEPLLKAFPTQGIFFQFLLPQSFGFHPWKDILQIFIILLFTLYFVLVSVFLPLEFTPSEARSPICLILCSLYSLARCLVHSGLSISKANI